MWYITHRAGKEQDSPVERERQHWLHALYNSLCPAYQMGEIGPDDFLDLVGGGQIDPVKYCDHPGCDLLLQLLKRVMYRWDRERANVLK